MTRISNFCAALLAVASACGTRILGIGEKNSAEFYAVGKAVADICRTMTNAVADAAMRVVGGFAVVANCRLATAKVNARILVIAFALLVLPGIGIVQTVNVAQAEEHIDECEFREAQLNDSSFRLTRCASEIECENPVFAIPIAELTIATSIGSGFFGITHGGDMNFALFLDSNEFRASGLLDIAKEFYAIAKTNLVFGRGVHIKRACHTVITICGQQGHQ